MSNFGSKEKSSRETDQNVTQTPGEIDKLVRTAVILVIVGLALVMLFLVFGFRSWSVGLGIFLGMPVMILGVALYVIAVLRDLRHRKVLE